MARLGKPKTIVNNFSRASQSVSGLKELDKKLAYLSEEVATKTLNTANRKSGLIIRDAIREQAPVDSGKLRRNIAIKKINKKKTESQSHYAIHVRETGKADNPKNAYYAYFVIFGTAYQQPNNFVARGYDHSKQRYLTDFALQLKKKIDRVTQ